METSTEGISTSDILGLDRFSAIHTVASHTSMMLGPGAFGGEVALLDLERLTASLKRGRQQSLDRSAGPSNAVSKDAEDCKTPIRFRPLQLCPRGAVVQFMISSTRAHSHVRRQLDSLSWR